MTPLDLTLRPATRGDAAALAAFAEHVFRETFGPHNRPEDIDAYCSTAFSLAELERELAAPYLYTAVAVTGGEIAGYAQLRDGAPPDCVTGRDPIELKRLYVDRRWQGAGVAQMLMAHAMDLAQQRGARTMYLAVWEHNHRAIAFYAKQGFEHVGVAPFQLGADLQHDPVMMRSLVERRPDDDVRCPADSRTSCPPTGQSDQQAR
jgi:ribosomal protein S18 acetylase RimI-like enzyme